MKNNIVNVENIKKQKTFAQDYLSNEINKKNMNQVKTIEINANISNILNEEYNRSTDNIKDIKNTSKNKEMEKPEPEDSESEKKEKNKKKKK